MAENLAADTDSESVESIQPNVARPRQKAEPLRTSTTKPKTIFTPLESEVKYDRQQIEESFGVKPVPLPDTAKRTHHNAFYEGDRLLLYFITYMLFIKISF